MNYLEAQRKEHQLSMLGVLFKEKGNMIRVEDPLLQFIMLQLPEDLIEAGFSGKEASRTLPAGEGETHYRTRPYLRPAG